MIKLRIRELAEQQGLNQSQLQRKSGVTLPMLNRYWHNYTQTANLEALGQIARVLGVRPGDLIEEVLDQKKEEMTVKTYQETSTESDTFFVDEIEDKDVIPVIEAVGGTVKYDESIQRMDGHQGRYRVQLPAGCTYTGTHGAGNPQTIILPNCERRLTVRPRGSYEVILHFLAGESSDPSLWDGAKRKPNLEEETAHTAS